MAHPGGRPVSYTPEDFLDKFDHYIADCTVNKVALPNIAGFCYFAKINTDTFYEYKNNRQEFSDCIKMIETKLEDSILNAKDTIKSIFYLKNKFKYVDKTEVATTNTHELLESKSVDELQDELKKLQNIIDRDN